MAILQMICTDEGYAITDEHGMTCATFSVAAGQPIFMDAYRNPKHPDVTSIFLRGVLAAYVGRENPDDVARDILNAFDDGVRSCVGIESSGTMVWKGSFIAYMERLRSMLSRK